MPRLVPTQRYLNHLPVILMLLGQTFPPTLLQLAYAGPCPVCLCVSVCVCVCVCACLCVCDVTMPLTSLMMTQSMISLMTSSVVCLLCMCACMCVSHVCVCLVCVWCHNCLNCDIADVTMYDMTSLMSQSMTSLMTSLMSQLMRSLMTSSLVCVGVNLWHHWCHQSNRHRCSSLFIKEKTQI